MSRVLRALRYPIKATGGDNWQARAEQAEARADQAEGRVREQEAEIARLRAALESFAMVADRPDAADFDDERVLRLVYDDPEWGDNTTLAEFFMRPFRKARAALNTKQGERSDG